MNKSSNISRSLKETRDYEQIITLGFCFLLFIFVFLSDIEIVTLFSAVISACYLLYLVYAEPHLIIKYFHYVVFVGMNLFGEFAVEFSSFSLTELGVSAGFVGGFPLLAFSRCLFLMLIQFLELHSSQDKDRSTYAVDSADSKTTKRILDLFDLIALFVVFGLVVCLLDAMRNGAAFTQGMSRFTYSQTYGSGSFSFLSDNLGVLMVFPLIALKEGRKAIGVSGIFLYIFYLLWVGNKFGSFLAFFALILVVNYDKFGMLNPGKIKKLLFSSVAVLFVLISLATFVQSSLSSTTPMDYLGQRLAQQGQLWWRTFDKSDGVPHLEELNKEIGGQIFSETSVKDNIGSDFGIYKVMYYCAPTNIIDSHLRANAAYSEAGYAAMYYYFGVIGPLIFSVVMSLLVFWIQSALVRAVVQKNLISAVLLARFTAIAHNGLTMFIFTNFFKVTSIGSYVWLAYKYIINLRKKS